MRVRGGRKGKGRVAKNKWVREIRQSNKDTIKEARTGGENMPKNDRKQEK